MTNPFTGKVLKPFSSNKKTYIVAAGIVVLGVLEAFGVHVPSWIYVILGGTGLAAHRASITNIASAIDDVGGMVTETRTPVIVLQPQQVKGIAEASAAAQAVSETPEYQAASETGKSDLLNESQTNLSKGNL